MNGKPWTPRQLLRLRYLYPDTPVPEIAKLIRRSDISVYQKAAQLGLKRSAEFLAADLEQKRQRFLTHPAIIAARMKQGEAPWNKGKSYMPGGDCSKGWFKPGQISKRWDPEVFIVGALRINTLGGLDIKLSEGARSWKALSHYVWFLHTGAWPPRGHVIRPRDGDAHNTQFDNLELITMAENMRRNSFWLNQPPEMARLYQLKGAITRQVRRIERQGAHA